ncbi:uncharacterized protein EI90DRAFT_3143820 [Cantharellus anzutake]|uniref:uncharacterized protein n=1 Tax=Cantharellus anzutake TaxID=1750568 RepID=UPI0019082736|nr:uncharacterized protein EI90DRAFT_3143820 [Cantharellus anzutake]KAF8340330.1 hypothetical protein EI90DRAFT_3143820 [Cantharellus anzutake]
MPPKKQEKQASSSKAAIDKTFGLKNKKGAKNQKLVAQIKQQQSVTGKSPATLAKERERELRAKEKAEAEKKAKEDAKLFAQAPQKVPPGVDPKSIYCNFHKAGYCERGNKCKFSHDPDVGRRSEKKDIYFDSRDEKANDTMDQWDEQKLRTVVDSKKNKPTTDIVCKYFIDAIESQKFGWFWTCPNDVAEKNGCIYRHALPPGFMLKSQKKAMDAEKVTISLEEFIEVERHKLGKNLTPVTPETFEKWKQNRQDKKLAEEEARKAAKDAKHAAGKSVGMSGRDLFSYNPEWFEADDEEQDGGDEDWDWATYRKQQEEENEREEKERIDRFNEAFSVTTLDEGP